MFDRVPGSHPIVHLNPRRQCWFLGRGLLVLIVWSFLTPSDRNDFHLTSQLCHTSALILSMTMEPLAASVYHPWDLPQYCGCDHFFVKAMKNALPIKKDVSWCNGQLTDISVSFAPAFYKFRNFTFNFIPITSSTLHCNIYVFNNNIIRCSNKPYFSYFFSSTICTPYFPFTPNLIVFYPIITNSSRRILTT